jgi:hypothetical protein
VNGDAVTLTFRRTNSAEEKAAFALAGSAAPGTDDQYLADLRSYVDLFNRTYELYGRHVVVKDYNGQGDNLQEDQGQDLGGAQADAATAHDLGAFMDISQSPTLAMTQPYAEDLAQEHVIAVGGLGLPKSWMRRYSPYEYSVTPDGNKGVTGAVNGLCARAVGMPAIFAGDPLYQQQTRAFGLVAPENPVYQELADQFENGMKACGANIAHRVSYSINVATEGQQATSIAAQMKTRGVTTVLCACDPIFEILISQNAWQQKYVPEWFVVAWLDPQGRQAEQNEWKHAISGEGTSPPKAQSEAYRVFKLANPKGEPQEKYFPVAYYTALYVFELLQLAGPNLNPLTVRQGAFAMPRSDLGDVGVWGGGPEAFDPVKSTQIGYWDPNAVSNFDGVAGGWVSCEAGKWFPLEDPSAYGPAHTQPHCFGR